MEGQLGEGREEGKRRGGSRGKEGRGRKGEWEWTRPSLGGN